jgi:hypothetical protein
MKIHAARVIYSILFFVLSMALLLITKPAIIFDRRTGEPLPFGIGEGKTLYSLGIITAALAILSFYFFAWIDMIFS